MATLAKSSLSTVLTKIGLVCLEDFSYHCWTNGFFSNFGFFYCTMDFVTDLGGPEKDIKDVESLRPRVSQASPTLLLHVRLLQTVKALIL